MNIGMLADTYKPYISGVTNHIALNKSALEALGHRVFVFTLGGEEHVDEESSVIRSPAIALADTGFNVSFRYSRSAQRKLAEMDVVHVHHPFVSGRIALRYCRSNNIPLVFTNHTRYDLYAQTYLPQVPNMLSDAFLHTFLSGFCRQCNLVIAPAPGLADVLHQFGVDSAVEIIPNGVELTGFQGSHKASARGSLGLSDEDKAFIYVGRLAPEKNLTMLLRSFAGAQAAVDRLHLIVVGGGPELDNLRDWCDLAGIASRVHFLGEIPYDAVATYLHMADAFVTASTSEVHPLSLIEALAVGLPVVGIQSPGVEDMIRDGHNGFLCRNDLAEFTAPQVRLMLDDKLRVSLGERAAKSAQSYDIRRTSRQLLAHYEALLAKSDILTPVPRRMPSFLR